MGILRRRFISQWNVEAAIREYAFFTISVARCWQRVTVSQRVRFCAGTHDYSNPDFPSLGRRNPRCLEGVDLYERVRGQE